MSFAFLFDPKRELLSIGYRVADESLDPNYYDLLASEARLASFVAIAKGDLPTRHWFRLGRALVPLGFRSALISWSGSMFEYLMPSLVMRAPAGSLLERTSRLMVHQQIKYGAMRGVPWGASKICLQCARPRTHISVFELWHSAGSRIKAGARRKHRHRPLCDGTFSDGRPLGSSAQLRSCFLRRLVVEVGCWLVRGFGLHKDTSS